MVPQKASGGGGGGGRGSGVGGRSRGSGVVFFLNWTKNRLKLVSKVRNFWLCVFSDVVATTLIILFFSYIALYKYRVVGDLCDIIMYLFSQLC